ncbi:hypothetical protein [Haemophilus influenzae]|uniref:hypothetical protein n=1 Tax=Haemophilus influenzae TaxID=727 RepID=UPI003DA6797E
MDLAVDAVFFASVAVDAAVLAAVEACSALLFAVVTLSFVCFSCLPVTASVLDAESVASANPEIFLLLAFIATPFCPIVTPFALTPPVAVIAPVVFTVVTDKLSPNLNFTVLSVVVAETTRLVFSDLNLIGLSVLEVSSVSLSPALILNELTLVDNAYNCAPFTASVEVAVTSPAATFLIWRLMVSLPTETTPLPSVCLILSLS